MSTHPEDVMITVRTGSSRLPKKCLLPLERFTIIAHVIKRCQNFGLNPIIATTNLQEDLVLHEISAAYNIRCYAGSVEDKMQRWLNAADIFNIERFAVVDCDDPFFDPNLTKKVYELTKNYDFVMPDMTAYLGSHGMGINVEALRKACSEKKQANTEMVWKHINSSDIFQLRLDDVNIVEHNLRLTVDYQEDYWLACIVARELGINCTREDIVGFFDKNCGLRLINDFRNVAWKLRQDTQ